MGNETNRIILQKFYDYMQSKDLKSEHHIINLLVLLVSLDKFLCKDGLNKAIPFTSINSKELILTFLNHHQLENGKWVKREHDAEGKYASSFNQNKRLLSVFFRWLFNSYCNNRAEEDWETPAFLKFKSKRQLRDSPYGINDIWQLDELLTIVSYEPELRNQAILTMLWDLDARPSEIVALRLKDIVLNEQYGEGNIPSNTKTGGGPILLTSSFTYVRDWLNRHPYKNEPNARLICSLINGAPIKAGRIWQILEKLRQRIRRLLESGSIVDVQQKQKLEYLLKTKKWGPYCFRHSAITDDSNRLPEYVVKKKARWTMGSRQANRYIKNTWGNDVKEKMLEHHGIKIANKQQQIISRTCGSCGYVNKLESKFCEAKGCHYPQTQLALDEIKAAEQSKMQELVNESNLERDNTIQTLQQELKSKTQEMQSLSELCKHSLELSSKQNGTISDYKGMVDDVNSRYHELMGLYENLKSKFDKSMSLTKDAIERVDELQNDMIGGLLIKLGEGTVVEEDLDRGVKILRYTIPEEERRVPSGQNSCP
jgi:integrase/recombinase XerD